MFGEVFNRSKIAGFKRNALQADFCFLFTEVISIILDLILLKEKCYINRWTTLNFQLHCRLIIIFIKKTQPTIEVALTILKGKHIKFSVKLPVSPTKHKRTHLIGSVI